MNTAALLLSISTSSFIGTPKLYISFYAIIITKKRAHKRIESGKDAGEFIKEQQKDPKFIKAAREFIRLSTS